MKRLSTDMIEMLMDCHEREIMNLEPCAGIKLTATVKGLVGRGLIEPRDYTSPTSGKTYLAYFVTKAGKDFLEAYLKK